jgi:hypothetical protein
MPYCSNCGASLNKEIKFCPSCGNKIEVISNKAKKTPKNKMEKGVIKSLKNETSNFVKSKITKTTPPSIPDNNSPNIQKKNETNLFNKSSKKITKAKKLMIYYFLLNIPIFFINNGEDEILGVLVFSGIILLLYLIRMGNEKPIHIILKIIMGLQALLMLSTIMVNLENIFNSILAFIAIIALVFLLIITIKVILKGNKTV